MRRDNKSFRERFLRWKSGELVYLNGRALPRYEEGKDPSPWSILSANTWRNGWAPALYVGTPTPRRLEYNQQGDYYYGGRLADVTVRGHKPYWVGANTQQLTVSNVMKGVHTAVNPVLAWTSPSQYVGAIRDAMNGENPFISMMRGNSGFVTPQFEQEHPLISAVLNLAGDIATPVAASRVANSSAARTLWNNGRIIQRLIPRNHDNYYRVVGQDAIADANQSGWIRSKGNYTGPYFGRGGWEGNINKGYVIEGTPNSATWIDAHHYDNTIRPPRLGASRVIVNNGRATLIPYTQAEIDAIANRNPVRVLSGNRPTSINDIHAFPYVDGSTTVPSSNFTYWLKHPIIGWRLHLFKQPTGDFNINNTPRGLLSNEPLIARGVPDVGETRDLPILFQDQIDYYRRNGIDALTEGAPHWFAFELFTGMSPEKFKQYWTEKFQKVMSQSEARKYLNRELNFVLDKALDALHDVKNLTSTYFDPRLKKVLDEMVELFASPEYRMRWPAHSSSPNKLIENIESATGLILKRYILDNSVFPRQRVNVGGTYSPEKHRIQVLDNEWLDDTAAHEFSHASDLGLGVLDLTYNKMVPKKSLSTKNQEYYGLSTEKRARVMASLLDMKKRGYNISSYNDIQDYLFFNRAFGNYNANSIFDNYNFRLLDILDVFAKGRSLVPPIVGSGLAVPALSNNK